MNTNPEIHRMKRDPYRQLLRLAAILAVILVAGIGIFYFCSILVANDYKMKVETLERENIEAEQEFNAKMAALRDSRSGTSLPSQTERGERPFWEATIEDALWRIEDEGDAGLENTTVITVDRSDLINGGLLLVNHWHPLPLDFSDAALVNISSTSLGKIQVRTEENPYIFQNAYDALAAMVTDAGQEGLEHYAVWEAYRSMEKQQENFSAEMERLSSKYSGDILEEQAKKNVNYPGTSEFQTGMSFRMRVYKRGDNEVNNLSFQQSDQGMWFTQNAWKYGVIFRFPTKDFPTPAWEDKSYKTGVSVELNLYRYVGKAHAAAMRILNYCLEEYVEFLADHPHISIYKDGALQFEVFRLPTTEVLPVYSLPVPNVASDYQASLDNMDAVVMAYTYNQ